MVNVIEKSYEAKLDTKHRLTVRGSKTRHYAVRIFTDGHILLSPQKLVDDPPISARTMKQIASSMQNLKHGKVSAPINIKEARSLFKGEK